MLSIGVLQLFHKKTYRNRLCSDTFELTEVLFLLFLCGDFLVLFQDEVCRAGIIFSFFALF